MKIIRKLPLLPLLIWSTVSVVSSRRHSSSEMLSSEKEVVFDDNFSYFSLKPYVVTPHLNRLTEPVWMRGHNIRYVLFLCKINKMIPNYHRMPPHI